jgi:hypothetical protein
MAARTEAESATQDDVTDEEIARPCATFACSWTDDPIALLERALELFRRPPGGQRAT